MASEYAEYLELLELSRQPEVPEREVLKLAWNALRRATLALHGSGRAGAAAECRVAAFKLGNLLASKPR